jgi:hypothetical protein
VTQPIPGLPPEAEAFRQAQIAEYDGHVALGPIRTPSGALAYAAGHPVPATNVDSDGRVVIDRHVCNHPDGELCEWHSKPTAWSDPGSVELTDAGKKRQARTRTSKPDVEKKG